MTLNEIAGAIVKEHFDHERQSYRELQETINSCTWAALWQYIKGKRKWPLREWLLVLKYTGGLEFKKDCVVINTKHVPKLKEYMKGL